MPDPSRTASSPPAASTTPNGTAGRPYIGGQAVLEGVMMRSPTSFAIVVRSRDGALHVRERAVPDGRKGLAKLPFARGVASLVESLRLGGEALRFSGDIMERDLEEEERAAKRKSAGIGSAAVRALTALAYGTFLLATTSGTEADAPPESGEKVARDERGEHAGEAKDAKSEGSRAPMILMLGTMIAFMIILPQAVAAGINSALGFGLEVQSPGFQALTGAFKLAIVVGYMVAIRSFIPYIRRVFQYHGAEHKTISTYEAGEPLTVENARAKTTLHARCGTTFLVMVALVSILVFTAVGSFLPKIATGQVWLDNLIFVLEKLPFVPVIVAVTFEIQRLFARYCMTGPLRALLWPGFLVQKITTIEPDDAQLEVALASLRVTLFREQGEHGEAKEDLRYAGFDELMGAGRLRSAA